MGLLVLLIDMEEHGKVIMVGLKSIKSQKESPYFATFLLQMEARACPITNIQS